MTTKPILDKILKCMHKHTNEMAAYTRGCPQCQEIIYTAVSGMADMAYTFAEIVVEMSDNTKAEKEEILELIKKDKTTQEQNPDSLIGYSNNKEK